MFRVAGSFILYFQVAVFAIDECVTYLSRISVHRKGQFIAQHHLNSSKPGELSNLPLCSEVGKRFYPLFHRHRKKQWNVARAAAANYGELGTVFFLPIMYRMTSALHTFHAMIPALHLLTNGNYQNKLSRIVLVDFASVTVVTQAPPQLRLLLALFKPFLNEQAVNNMASFQWLDDLSGFVFDEGIWGLPAFPYTGHHVRTFSEHVVNVFGIDRPERESRKIVIVDRGIYNVDALVAEVQDIATPLELQIVDSSTRSLTEQLQIARSADIWFGSHGDGLAWSIFMPVYSVLLEAVPMRNTTQVFSSCVEGWDSNPVSGFGSFAREAGLSHACWRNPAARDGSLLVNEVKFSLYLRDGVAHLLT
eukprot:gene522-958_t